MTLPDRSRWPEWAPDRHRGTKAQPGHGYPQGQDAGSSLRAQGGEISLKRSWIEDTGYFRGKRTAPMRITLKVGI